MESKHLVNTNSVKSLKKQLEVPETKKRVKKIIITRKVEPVKVEPVKVEPVKVDSEIVKLIKRLTYIQGIRSIENDNNLHKQEMIRIFDDLFRLEVISSEEHRSVTI